jgi:hypothetical protein
MRLFLRSDGRYYAIHDPAPDLLGDRVILTIHGRQNSRLGGVHTYLADKMALEDIVRQRLRHGYVETPL